MADGSVPIVLSPEPFARTTTYVEAPEGCTVRTMLASAVGRGHLTLDDLARTNVYVDGVRLDRDQALTMVLREGQVVNVVVEPLGGGGGKKDVGQILLSIAVIAVSMWVGGPAGPLQAWPMLARQVAAAAILTAGQMAVAALFKPESNVTKTNDRYALSSASNQYRPWGSMPLALGEVVVAPDLAVKTFTQSLGEDQWIYGILGLHYGPCTADDLKIGDTLVSSMGASDVRVAYHLTPGPRTFSIVANDTDQLDLQEELQATVSGSTPVIRAGSAEGERFEFDFFLPQGLYFAKDDGRKIAASLTVTIRYRPVDQNGVPTGSGAWQVGLTIPLTSSSSDPWRLTRSLSLPLGRYQFEVKRSKLEDDNAKRKTDIGWTAVRAIAFRKPVADETLSLIEFAVRASALNQGSLAPLTCRITPICETWTGTTWGGASPTSNPAAVARWLMTGPAPALPLSSIQADRGLRSWAALCDQYDWKTHLYLTEDRKQDAVLQLLGVNGRASLFWDGTQLVASPWTEKPAPRQLFAGSNLKDHRWEIVFPDPVHALRVEFQNIEQGGEADEVYVYADGYGESADPAKGIEAATLVEALRLEGQQTLERAYREGRWNLAARLHQRRVDSWSTDIEHIVCRYGDRVRLGWDRVGAANATVRNRVWSGGLVSGVRLSQPVRMEPGRSYAMDLRLPDQVLTGVPVINAATTTPVVTRTVHFVDLRNANVSPRGGDLVAFGEPERISEDVEVIGITPGPDLTATLVGVRYVAPLLMAAETGPIPPLQSRLTRERSMDPPMPTLLGWQADAEGVRIGFSMPPWRGSPITGFTLRWRQTPAAGQSSAWVPLPDLPANAMTAVLPPLRELPAEATNRTSAQAQIVAVTADGRASPPLQVTVYEQAIQQPPAGDWSVTPLTDGPDGSRQSGFLVIGLVGSINPRRVTVEYGASANGPWDAAFDGPPVGGVVRAPVLGMQPGAQCWIAITYWTAQAAAPSVRRVLGPFTAPDLIAGDLSPESPVRIAVTEITNRLVSVEQISATNAAAVADLEEVFGDTVSAAASAASAIQQAAIATQAKADAIIAEGGALAAKADAIQAKSDAQTARGQAEGFRDQSSSAASTASGAAATATDQAGLAATARGEAQGFAGAALAYRNQASGFVTDAETAAAASSASSVTATASKDAAKNYAINQGSITPSALLWTNNPNGVPETATDATYPVVTVGGKPSIILGDNQHVFWKRAVPFVAGHVYEIQVEVEPSTASAAEISLIIWQLDGSYADLPAQNYQLTSKSIPVRGLYTQRFTPNAATVWLRPAVKGEMGGSKNPRIFSLNIIDVTAQAAAEASATAASTSASSAAASETAAGQSASAANTAKVAAETARGQAEAFKNETASSRDTATAQAALATAQAGLSAGSATLAGQKADAAAESASLASTKADEAGVAAAVSTAQKLEAVAARDEAYAAKDDTKAAKDESKTAANAAAIAAASAAASDTKAGQKAAAAEGSATTADTKAGEALTYRNQSASSAADAAGYSQAAQVASGTSVAARDDSQAARDQSQAAAATAIQQTSEATAAAAAAQISANLAASVSAPRGQLLYNSTGNQGMDGWAGGPNWYAQDIGYGFGRGFGCGVSGSYFYNDSAHFAGIAPESWVTWSADLKVFGGTCDLWLEFYDGGFNRIGGNYAQRQVSNRDFGDPISSEVLAPAGALNARLVVLPTFSSGGSAGVRRMKVERGRLPATAWSDEETTKALAAQLNITTAVAADAQTRLASVIFEIIGASGGDPFQLLFRTIGSNSYGRLVASALEFCNVVGGQVVTAMKLIGGEVFFMRPIYIDVGSSRLIVGPGGTWVLWFGATSQTAATATRTNGAFCLGTDGKVYYGTGLLASGVTQAKIANFSGNVGRPAPLMVAGQTEAVTVPQNGRFIVEMTNGLTSSFSDSAGGLLRLYISKDGVETHLGSLNVNAARGDFYFDLSALNLDIAHNFAGAVKFVVKTNGNGPSTDGQGTVSGTLKATYYPN